MMKRKVQFLAAAAAICIPAAAQADENDLSFRLVGLAGIAADDSEATGADDGELLAALPSLAMGGDFTIQVDGMLADHRHDGAYGGALHAGADLGEGTYLGLYASVAEVDRFSGLTTYRLGGEVEFDLGSVGIASVAGYEDSESGAFYVRTTATDDIYDVYPGGGEFFAFTDLRFMPSASSRLSIGHRYTGDRHAAAAGLAIGFGNNVALIAEGRLGEGDYEAGMIGLRVLFGGAATPGHRALLDNRLIEDLFTAGNGRRSLADPLPPPPDDEEDDGCGSCGGYCAA
ncbi:MAG: hypothetical protein KDE15_14020 [Erythrobacter sp.]|nr:hypothetical protein [Erythrobacter sp.]